MHLLMLNARISLDTLRCIAALNRAISHLLLPHNSTAFPELVLSRNELCRDLNPVVVARWYVANCIKWSGRPKGRQPS